MEEYILKYISDKMLVRKPDRMPYIVVKIITKRYIKKYLDIICSFNCSAYLYICHAGDHSKYFFKKKYKIIKIKL